MKEILLKEYKKLFEITDKLFDERFTTSKHNDRWNDDLFKQYIKQKTRIEVVIELIENDIKETEI